jgi:hypothetical protein
MKEWKEVDHKISYYFMTSNGRIVGQTYNLAHTSIYGAKIIDEYCEEKYLGQYISFDFARRAVEHYWNVQERTLPFENNG